VFPVPGFCGILGTTPPHPIPASFARSETADLKADLTETETATRPAASVDADTTPCSLFPLPLLVILATACAVVVPFLVFGIPSGHDFEFHMNSWMEVLNQWRQGILYPRWAALAHYGYGEPRFVFYPPASWILGAALGAVLPWAVAPAAYQWLALSLSGCSMFLLARRWLGRNDAIFAAALYAANPYYLVIVYWRSAYAELLAGALLPLVLLLVLRLEEEGRKWIVPLGLVVALGWLTNAPSSVMINYSLGLLLILLAIRRRSPRVLFEGGLAILLGAALAGFYLVPATYEQRWVDISQAVAEGVRPQDNFLFTRIDDPRHNQFNLLVSVLALAEMAGLAVAAISRRRWRREIPQVSWLLAAWATVSAVLLFSVTSPVWNHFPKLRFVQLPWRWLLCFNVAFALLITTAWRRWFARLLLYAVMLAVLAFAGHRFQMPWWDHAPEIAKLEQSIWDSGGYEGTDEYIPVEADGYEISHEARRVTFKGQGADQIHVLEWGPESKLFTAQVSSSGQLVLRLFNYPAWRVEVNGRVVTAASLDVTGQMTIPVKAGENQVRVTFSRTRDRTIGGTVSGVSALLIVGLAAFRGKQRPLPKSA
jgi:6-pyruvoyl-tetrahydropterin synthase related domain